MNKSENLIFSKKIFLFILFINIIFLLVTLSHSYTDGYNLRQAQTAVIAKNIFYDNFNIFPTRISFLAPSKGNINFELPFVHFLTALTYKVFPISEINGRIINLLFYITPNMSEEYGGNLELWDKEIENPIKIDTYLKRGWNKL